MIRPPDTPWSPQHPPGWPATGHDPLEGITAQGTIATGAARQHLAPAFQPLLDSAIERLLVFGAHHSLYVYGSVATGTARLGISDVDLVTLGLGPSSAVHMAQALSGQYAQLCRGVDIGAAQWVDHDGPSDRAYGNRVFLRHYCVHLAGPDLARGLPDFAADAAAARGFNGDIGLCAARWQADVLRDPCPSLLGRRIARKLLLAVAGLVSVHDAIWTTDRAAAAWRWGLLHPDLAPALQELVPWSEASTSVPSPPQIQAALAGVVASVVAAFERNIGLWR